MPEERSAATKFSRIYVEAAIYSRMMIFLIGSVFLINTIPIVYAGLNWSEADSSRFAGLFGLINLLFQLLIIKRILQLADSFAGSDRSFIPRMFGVQILYFLAVGIGFLCLVLPGIYIALRWSLALPAMISGDRTIAESFRASWNLTEGKWMELLILSLPVLALYATAFSFAFVPWENVDPLIYLTIIESLTSLAIILPWIIFTVIYIRLARLEGEKT